MAAVWRHMNLHLVRWMMRKHKPLQKHRTREGRMLWLMAKADFYLYVHWKVG